MMRTESDPSTKQIRAKHLYQIRSGLVRLTYPLPKIKLDTGRYTSHPPAKGIGDVVAEYVGGYEGQTLWTKSGAGRAGASTT